MWADIALVVFFVLVGGFFAAAELALVSLRPGQVSRLAGRGRRGRQVAHLLEDPNRFLSAVQIGVTLAGMFSSAVGAVALARPLTAALASLGLSEGLAGTVSLVIVTVLVSYVSLVFGELAPKRLALQRAEGFALFTAGPLTTIARITRPVIWLLARSTDLVVTLAGGRPDAHREEVTEEELRDLVATSSELSADERRIVADVLDAGDRPLREIMVPRLDVSALPVGLTLEQAVARTADRPYSRYPVVDGGLDDVVGFVHLRDLLCPPGRPCPPGTTVGDLVRPVMRLPDTRRALPALAEMRRGGGHLAVVVDEYGGSAGIVTLEDLLEELVGDITDEFDPYRGPVVPAPTPALPIVDVSAQLRLDEFAERTGVRLPDGPYDTAAGWVLHELGRIPLVGDAALATQPSEQDGERRVRLVVTRMHRRRVEGLRVEDAPVASGRASGDLERQLRPYTSRPGAGLARAQ
jgi:putative hemolysin